MTKHGCQIRAALLVLLVTMLAGCSSPELAPTPQPTAIDTLAAGSATPSPTPTVERTNKPCSAGKLLVGDLPAVDQVWRQGLEQATAKAVEWQQDAVLSNLRVVCQLFEPAFRWQATFYSRNAQAFFSSDTGEVVPAGVEESAIPTLNTEQLSFALLHDVLNKAGFADDFEISPSSGVDIRVNSVDSPFGPPEAPDDVILYHVSIKRLGEVKDVFVDGRDGTIYVYTM